MKMKTRKLKEVVKEYDTLVTGTTLIASLTADEMGRSFISIEAIEKPYRLEILKEELQELLRD